MERKQARAIVLISCYNGEKYLREQLDSILQQTYASLEILARDDGSTDSTASILAEYERATLPGGEMQRYGKTIRVLRDGLRLGYPECFYELMRNAQGAQYIAFSDQDDWWYPEKIERAVEALEAKGGSGKPLLTFCESEQCGENLNSIRVRKTPDEIGLPACALNASLAPGFAIVITRALMEIAIPRATKTSIHHDRLLCRAAAYFGEIVPERRAYAKHRLHDTSYTAEHRPDSGTKIEREDGVWRELRAENAEFLKRYGDLLNTKAKKEVETFSTASKWKRALYPKRLRKGLRSEWKLRARYLRETPLPKDI